jgi:Ser-tRNA(Ala) deacylase AlaX
MTQQIYLKDTYLFTHQGIIRSVQTNNFGTYLLLDQTIFYPQGGGQPSDVGFISSQEGNFQVTKTVWFEEDIYHYGEFISGSFQTGQEVKLAVNEDKRRLNARNHSAGHVIDLAVNSLDKEFGTFEAGKGFHFPEGPYVEYKPEKINQDWQKLADEIGQKANQIILKNPTLSFYFTQGRHLSGKPERIMQVEGYADCPCGGTHVSQFADIGSISIRKVKIKDGNLRVAYEVI